MLVKVLNRSGAVLYCYSEHKDPAVMISISDPRMEYKFSVFCSETNKLKEILPLCFSDAESVAGTDVYGNPMTSDDLMSDEDARKVVDFVEKYRNELILVHCDAGISRSAGVAAAILKACTGDDTQIFDNPYYVPNRWCYRKVLDAFAEQEEQNAKHLAH